VMQIDNSLTDACGHMIAEGLKSSCSVMEVHLVSAAGLLVLLLLLTCVEQAHSSLELSEAVKREITDGLQKGHGVDKGVAIGSSCLFFDFETCEKIDLTHYAGSEVRLPAS
jgi:hypothetical protein